jgi:O-antigen ligase
MLAGRFRGFFINPNNIGVLAAVAGGIVLARYLRDMSLKNIFALVIIGTNLILAGSRTALLGISAVLILLLVRFMVTKPAYGILLLIMIGTASLAFAQTDFFAERVLREASLSDASNRTYFWALAKAYISNRWLLGHGFGTDMIIHEHYGVHLRDLQLRGAGVMSSYYGLAVQIGVPLTLVFFGTLWGYILYILTLRAQNFWSYSYAAVLAGGLVLSAFEPVLFSAGNVFSFFYWIVFMLLVRREVYSGRGIPLGVNGEVISVRL